VKYGTDKLQNFMTTATTMICHI